MVGLIYAFFAFSGFYLYGTAAKADVLLCFPKKSIMVAIGRLGIALNVTLSCPLQVSPCRDAITQLAYGIRAKDLDNPRYYGLTYFLLAAATGIAMIVDDIQIVFGLVGATCGTLICFILPGYFFVKLVKDQARVRRALSYVVFVFGIVCMPV